MQGAPNQQPRGEENFYERLRWIAKAHINRKKRLSARRRQAQVNYKKYLYDLCIHSGGRSDPM